MKEKQLAAWFGHASFSQTGDVAERASVRRSANLYVVLENRYMCGYISRVRCSASVHGLEHKPGGK